VVIARAGAWRRWSKMSSCCVHSATQTVDEALGAVEAYRGLARDLATARRVAPIPHDGRTRALYANSTFDQSPASRRARGGAPLLAFDIPTRRANCGHASQVCGAHGRQCFCRWWLVATSHPDQHFASENMIEQVEQGHLWTEGMINIMPRPFFRQYLANTSS